MDNKNRESLQQVCVPLAVGREGGFTGKVSTLGWSSTDTILSAIKDHLTSRSKLLADAEISQNNQNGKVLRNVNLTTVKGINEDRSLDAVRKFKQGINELKTFYKNGKPILIVANVTFKEYLSVKEKKKSKHKRVAVKNKKRKKKVAKTSSNKKQNTNSSKSKKASSSKSKKKSVSSKKSGGYITYTLKKTDTLWNLAKKYYGSGDKYKKIYNANKSLQQGYKLKPGSTIRIPKK